MSAAEEKRVAKAALRLHEAFTQIEIARRKLSDAVFELQVCLEGLAPLPKEMARIEVLLVRAEVLMAEIMGAKARLQVHQERIARMSAAGRFG